MAIIQGDIDINNLYLKKIPSFLKGTTVTGNFRCEHNSLSTSALDNSPRIVEGDFYCAFNKLTSLKGAPKQVNGFYCSYNNLTSLEGGPEIVNGFYCSFNKLTSLKGAPKQVNGFYCSYNNLTSLEGGPEIVNGNFNCSNNKLLSLEGCPSIVNGNFICKYNRGLRITAKLIRKYCKVNGEISILNIMN